MKKCVVVSNLFEEIPDDYACRDGNIKAVFCSKLWQFNAIVTEVNDILLHAKHFVSENDSVFFILLWHKVLKLN